MTPTDLARYLGVQPLRVRQWEMGKTPEPAAVHLISKWHAEEVPVLSIRRDATFASRVKARRLEWGMTREELARKLGVAYSTIRGWENSAIPETGSMDIIRSWFAEKVPHT